MPATPVPSIFGISGIPPAPVFPIPVGPNSNRNPTLHTEDETRWLGISETSITLGDGILQSVGLLENPYGKSGIDLTVEDNSVTEFDIENLLKSSNESSSKSIQNLDQRLTQFCAGSINELRSYQHNSFNLLRAMWNWKYKYAIKAKRAFYDPDFTSEAAKLGGTKESGEKSLTSRFSLMLLVPLLKSQSSMDAELAGTTANLLLEMLGELGPMSLAGEFQKPLDQLENLLEHWINEPSPNNESALRHTVGPSAMVGLACARGSLFSFLRTVQLVQSLEPDSKLPVSKFLKTLPSAELRIGKPCTILGTQHICTFPYDKKIVYSIANGSGNGENAVAGAVGQGIHTLEKEKNNSHYIASDGTFLYVSGTGGKGVSKIGSGYNGTIRGFVYLVNSYTKVKHLAFGENQLVTTLDQLAVAPSNNSKVDGTKDLVPWGSIVNRETLERSSIIWTRNDEFYETHKTLAFTSDGKFFYKLLMANPPTPGNAQTTDPDSLEREISDGVINVYLEIFELLSSDDNSFYTAMPVKERLLLEFSATDFISRPSERDFSRMPSVRVATTNAQALTNALNAATGVIDLPIRNTQDRETNLNLVKPTSLGFKFEELNKATMMSCGSFVTIIVDYSLTKSSNVGEGTTRNSSTLKSVNAAQIEVSLSGSNTMPTYTLKKLVDLPSQSSFFKEFTSVPQVGITYDSWNNLIWTSNGEYLDIWKSTSLRPPWMQQAHLMVTDPAGSNYDEEIIDVITVLNSLWTHVGLIASSIHSPNNANELLELFRTMLIVNINAWEGTAMISFLRIFQTVLRNSEPLNNLSLEVLGDIYSQVSEIIKDPVLSMKFPLNQDFGVYFEAANVLSLIFDKIYIGKKERDNAVNATVQWFDTEDSENTRKDELCKLLKKVFLSKYTQKLNNIETRYSDVKELIFSSFVLAKFIEESIQGTMHEFDSLSELFGSENYNVQVTPITSYTTSYIVSCVNCILKSWVLTPKSVVSKEMRLECLPILKSVLNHSSTIIDRCIEFLGSQDTNHLAALISAENILKSSLVGLALPQLLVWLSEESMKDSFIAEELAEENIQFFVALSHLNDTISIRCDKNGRICFDDWASIIPKPLPFHNHRYFESQHPIKENTKIKETVIFNGANKLYIKFDPKSSTQYDYDKLTLQAGAGNEAKRIGEFGGNYFGYGNRMNSSVEPWPRDLIAIEGDTLTYSFEVRSGKEPNTPESVLWGYGFTVYPTYESYSTSTINAKLDFRLRTQTTEVGNILRESYFIDQLAMTSLDSICCMIRKLISAEPLSSIEEEINPLLNTDLLRNISWNSNSQRNYSRKQNSSFTDQILSSRLRELRNKGKVISSPRMRQRMSEIIRPEEIEKLYVLVCMKYLETSENEEAQASTSTALPTYSSKSYAFHPDVLHKAFSDIDCIIRKLVSITELQLKLVDDVDDIRMNGKSLDEIFVMNLYHENSESELENIALICDLVYDKSNPTSVIPDAISIAQAFVDAGVHPELTKAQELVEETIAKLKQLLAFENQGEEDHWICLDIFQAKSRIKEIYNYVYRHFTHPNSTIDNVCQVVEKHKGRAVSRSQGLQLMLKVLECSKHTSQSLIVASALLQESTNVEDISCSGLEKEIKEMIGLCLKSIVDVAFQNPLLHRNSITLLCTMQYKPGDERIIIESRLLKVLDMLCANEMELGDTIQVSDKILLKNSASMAWASFQVLAHRCASWNYPSSLTGSEEEADKLALPITISSNITNHLARAANFVKLATQGESEAGSINKGVSLSETVDDVLCLLDKLKDTKLGRAILKQNPCICQLLALLLDPRLSPRLVLLIIRLLTVALPLVKNLELRDLSVLNMHLMKKKTTNLNQQDLNPYSVVANLLLSKLADFLVVGNQYNTILKNSSSKQNETVKVIVWVLKPTGRPVSSILEILFDPNNKELLTTTQTRSEIEDILNRDGKVAIRIEEMGMVEKKFEKLRNAGLKIEVIPESEMLDDNILSKLINKSTEENVRATVPPVVIIGQSGSRNATTKGNLAAQYCKEKNIHLQKSDPVRAFLSGEVAEDLASELIQLLQHLLSPHSISSSESSKPVSSISSKESISTAPSYSGIGLDIKPKKLESENSIWISAVEQAVYASLKPLTKLCNVANTTATPVETYGLSARIAIAGLSVLGSFTEKVREGSTVYILNGNETFSNEDQSYDDWEFKSNKGKVVSLDQVTEIANVKLIPDDEEGGPLLTPSSFLYVPLNRLIPARVTKLPELSPTCLKNIAYMLTNLLLPSTSGASSRQQSDPTSPMKKTFPSLNQLFEKFGTTCNSASGPASTESKAIANSMTVIRLAAEIKTRAAHVMSTWMKKPEFVRVFLGLGSEMDITNTASINRDSVNAVNTLKSLAKECKASHRTRDVEKNITRLRLLYRDCTKPPRLTTATPPANETNNSDDAELESGYRLRRVSDSLHDLNFSLFYPYLREIDSESEFSFAEAETGSEDEASVELSPVPSDINIGHVIANDGESINDEDDAVHSDSVTESDEDDINEILPFIHIEPEESELDQGTTQDRPSGAVEQACPLPAKDCHIAVPRSDIKEYSPSNAIEYYLSPSFTYNVRVFNGPNRYVCPCSNKLKSELEFLLNDDELKTTSNALSLQGSPRTTSRLIDNDSEDPTELLVRAWETKVFPVVRRRFRNETERRDGLNQIRGALTEGMIDIARQTVEYLYEENGGIPRELHLPTLEEIKLELSRFTVDRIKIGMTVKIRGLKTDATGDDIVKAQKFCVGPMLKTFGLIGEVLNIDKTNELILVETYVESEGCLLRFYYPIKCLEKVSISKKNILNSHNIDMLKLHMHLVSLEVSLAKLYCREAFLQILNACNARHNDNTQPGDTSSWSKSKANLFKELDTENLDIRSQSSFANFRLNGDLLTYNLLYNTPSTNFLSDMGNPSVIFYNNYESLSVEINMIIRNAFENGEESLIKLAGQMCSTLEFGQDKFVFEDVSLDKEQDIEIALPNTAFTLISVRGPVQKKPGVSTSVTYKDPCVHIYASNSGDKKYPLVCYPLQTLASMQKQPRRPGSGNNNTFSVTQLRRKNLFPTVLAPTDKVTCIVSQGSLSGHTLEVTGIPPQFPLALLFCQQFIKFQQSMPKTNAYLSINLMTILLKFLQGNQLPPTIKEWIFPLLTEIIASTELTPVVEEFYGSQTLTFNKFFQEMLILYDYEVKPKMISLQSTSPFRANLETSLPIPIPGTSNQNRSNASNNTRSSGGTMPFGLLAQVSRVFDDAFNRPFKGNQNRSLIPILTSYFQSLLELCLNVSKVLNPIPNPTYTSPTISKVQMPSPPIKDVVKRNRTEPSDSDTSDIPQRKRLKPVKLKKSDTLSGLKSPEDITARTCSQISWFRQILYADKILHSFTRKEISTENLQFAELLIRECNEHMKLNATLNRVIIVTGVSYDNTVPADMTIESAITRGMKDVGGIFGNQLWISSEKSEAIFEIRSALKANSALEILRRKETWYPLDNLSAFPEVKVHRINENLETGDPVADKMFKIYLNEKLFEPQSNDKLSEKCIHVLTNIFISCYAFNMEHDHESVESDEYGTILLNKNHLTISQGGGNSMTKFIEVLTPINMDIIQFTSVILSKYGQKSIISTTTHKVVDKDETVDALVASAGTNNADFKVLNTQNESLGLAEAGFLEWCKQYANDDIILFWKALLSIGLDFQLNKKWSEKISALSDGTLGKSWTREQDSALVYYMNHLAGEILI